MFTVRGPGKQAVNRQVWPPGGQGGRQHTGRYLVGQDQGTIRECREGEWNSYAVSIFPGVDSKIKDSIPCLVWRRQETLMWAGIGRGPLLPD